jgi:hypothetical protein
MNPRFALGDLVRIDDRDEPRHHRVPAYVKGKQGSIARICAAHGRPELLATQDDAGPAETLYRVQLAQRDIWPDYQGAAGDSLEIEIFEHWLATAPGTRT